MHRENGFIQGQTSRRHCRILEGRGGSMIECRPNVCSPTTYLIDGKMISTQFLSLSKIPKV